MKWLAGSSLMVAAGLALVWFAKTQDFDAVSARLERGELVNLNAIASPAQLLPSLALLPGPDARSAAAESILAAHRPLANVGELARLHLPLARLKPVWVVRTPREFRAAFVGWVLLYFAGFWVVALAWRARKFPGDVPLLAAVHLLTGMGLILMVSLRDPLRDRLEFAKFAWGVAAGCALLLLPLLRGLNHRRLERWCYTPLAAAFGLFALLARFGSGPGGSDSKVNLGPFQPVELVKILLAVFLAAYFARHWELLRDLREKRFPFRFLNLPRFSHVLPVVTAVAVALALFFILKDLGPALVTVFLFMAMFAVARGRPGLAVAGVLLMVGGMAVGYRLGTPSTVAKRIVMWLSPWDNNVHGGDQLAHSQWALASGGAWGSGPGWGDPGVIPAGSTDLVLPAIGEEWGLAGVAAVLLLAAFVVHRALGTALRARTEHAFFLALGLGLLVAFEMLIISGGVLGLIPLSGVASPFLSSGNTSMLANFLILALLVSISGYGGSGEVSKPFARSLARLEWMLGACWLALAGAAAYTQVLNGPEILTRRTHVFEEDGVKRAQRNPRLNSIAREIRRGDIFDRNGVLLASSDWGELERRRAQYESLGVSIDTACSRLESRHYPFGPVTAHLLGDLRTGEKFRASNASLIEHDENTRLQGFADYNELAPLVRVRHQPGNPDMQRLRARDRSVRSGIDVRLQMRAAAILERRVGAGGKGALVVMDAALGDVLALVSYPLPGAPATPDELLDRARYGQYPPGSTFKLVTAMAALRTNPALRNQAYSCRPLGDGRVGARIHGWNRPIRDDVGDRAHGTLTLERALVVSCNAYFAQLGVNGVGAQALRDTAEALDIPAGEIAELRKTLPFASYGQGPVLVTPFKMARVAATIAAGGAMPQGRWIIDETNTRREAPRAVLAPDVAAFLARAMREVVTGGTARHAMQGETVGMAGKTGTAQLDQGQPHSWFAGFAPYDGTRRIAFAVVVEHGGYGARIAAPIAREVVEAARDLGIITRGEP